MRILEIGCGDGLVALQLVKHFDIRSYTAKDIDYRLIDTCLKNLAICKRYDSEEKQTQNIDKAEKNEKELNIEKMKNNAMKNITEKISAIETPVKNIKKEHEPNTIPNSKNREELLKLIGKMPTCFKKRLNLSDKDSKIIENLNNSYSSLQEMGFGYPTNGYGGFGCATDGFKENYDDFTHQIIIPDQDWEAEERALELHYMQNNYSHINNEDLDNNYINMYGNNGYLLAQENEYENDWMENYGDAYFQGLSDQQNSNRDNNIDSYNSSSKNLKRYDSVRFPNYINGLVQEDEQYLEGQPDNVLCDNNEFQNYNEKLENNCKVERAEFIYEKNETKEEKMENKDKSDNIENKKIDTDNFDSQEQALKEKNEKKEIQATDTCEQITNPYQQISNYQNQNNYPEEYVINVHQPLTSLPQLNKLQIYESTPSLAQNPQKNPQNFKDMYNAYLMQSYMPQSIHSSVHNSPISQSNLRSPSPTRHMISQNYQPQSKKSQKKQKTDTNKCPFSKINFETENYIENQKTDETYDIVMCFSVTKWIQLNWGDEGILRLFKKFRSQVKLHGIQILEPHEWNSYKDKKNLTKGFSYNYKRLMIEPKNYPFHLKNFGFDLILTYDKGFCGTFKRPIYIYRRFF